MNTHKVIGGYSSRALSTIGKNVEIKVGDIIQVWRVNDICPHSHWIAVIECVSCREHLHDEFKGMILDESSCGCTEAGHEWHFGYEDTMKALEIPQDVL